MNPKKPRNPDATPKHDPVYPGGTPSNDRRPQDGIENPKRPTPGTDPDVTDPNLNNNF